MNVLTQRNDLGRSGVNDAEATLTPKNVNLNTFGKLSSTEVTNNGIYAQPLYVSQLSFGAKGVFDTVFVASMDNRVSAIDANTGAMIAQKQIDGKPPVLSHENFGGQYNDIVGARPTIGILSTPVIDLVASEMCVALFTADQQVIDAPGTTDTAKVGAFQYILYAIDLTTLNVKRSAVIGGSVPGTGYAGSERHNIKPNDGVVSLRRKNGLKVNIVDATGVGTNNPRVHFNAIMQLQRPALLLADGVIYIAFGSRGDEDPWHGWIFAYDAATLNQLDILCTTPNGAQGGVWQAGQGLIADSAGNIYAGTGNGDSDQPNGGQPGTPNMGESFIKLRLEAGKLKIIGWYNAFDDLNYIPPLDPNPNADPKQKDDDLGASAPALLPDDRIVGGGKDGYFYLIDSNQLLGDSAARQHPPHPNNVVLQYFLAAYNFTRGTRPVPTFLGFDLQQRDATHHIHGSPVTWQNSPGSALAYVWGENDVLRAYSYAMRLTDLPLSGGFSAQGPIGTQPLITDTQDPLHVIPKQGVESARGIITASNENLQRDGMPGGFMSLSWDGHDPSTAVLWCTIPVYHNGNLRPVAGELLAFDAFSFDHQSNFSRITSLWRSGQEPGAEFVVPKFCCPTVVDGKVFQVGGDGTLLIFGLKPATGGGYDLSRDAATPSFGGIDGLTLNGSANVGTPVGRNRPIELTQNPHGIDTGSPINFPLPLVPTFHAGSVFCTQPVDVTTLQTRFTVQLGGITDPLNMADGFTFTVQAVGPSALGSSGSGFGYASDPSDPTNTTALIPRSLAIAFSIVKNTVSLWRDGVASNSPTAEIVDLGTRGIALNAGNPCLVSISYSHAASVLTLTVQDTKTRNSTGPMAISDIDLPAFLNLGASSLAHIGFTGGTGAKSSQQIIVDWSVP